MAAAISRRRDRHAWSSAFPRLVLACAQDRPSGKATFMRQAPASQALAKYKVLDLTRARAGPTAVRQLADWGAQVIKIELPGSDDSPDFMDRHSPDFQNLHRNKRSMTLNLKHPDGLAIFKQLARHADVIVENYRPDVKHRLGSESPRSKLRGIKPPLADSHGPASLAGEYSPIVWMSSVRALEQPQLDVLAMPWRIALFLALLPHILANDRFISVTAYGTDEIA